MKTLQRVALTIAICALLGASAWGQVTLPHYDGFNYTPGLNLGAQTGWASLNTGDSLFTVAGSLTYPGFAASSGNKIAFDGAGLDAAKRFDSVATGTAYYSYLLKVTSVGSLTATGGYFTTFYQSPTSTTGGSCVWTRLDGTAYDIGISVRITSPVSWSTIKDLNTTYLIVASYEFVAGATNDVCKIWINPDASTFGASTPPTETLTSTNNTTDLTGVARVQIRQDGLATTPFIELDELRIGTTWADVTPAAGASAVNSETGLAPRELRLEQNYPNPFNPTTSLTFTVPASGQARLVVFNALGQEVATLFNGEAHAGLFNNVQFNASGLASGMYYSRLEYNGNVQLKKMCLIK
jgi:hypothetical protein